MGSFTKVERTEVVEKKKFKPSPIISPVYGILNEDYRPEDIKNKSEVSTNNTLDFNSVRKKAFGEEVKEEPKTTYYEETVTVKLKENDEEKMIESLIYSLCELENIDKILIYVENKKLNELPNSKVKLPVSLDKSYGINKVYDIKSYKNVTKTTIYYASKTDDLTYYIPITKITNNDANAVEIIVKELKTSPIYESNLISFLNASYELKNYEIMENSVNMSFDNKMLLNLNDENITEKVKYTLSLSIRDTLGKDVSIKIN